MTRDKLLAELIEWDAAYDKAFKRDGNGDYNDADVNWDSVHEAEDKAVDLAQQVLGMLKDGRL